MGKRGRKQEASYEDPAQAQVVAACAAAVGGAAGSEEAVVAVQPSPLEARWATLKKTVGYCGLCQGIIRDFKKGHSSRRPNCKNHPDSRDLTEQELLELRQDLEQEFLDPKHARQKRLATAKERHSQSWKAPAEDSAPEPVVYTMTFGKHKRKTVQAAVAEDPGFMSPGVWKGVHHESPES
jgi:hypothetical protein